VPVRVLLYSLFTFVHKPCTAVPWLSLLAAGLFQRRPRFGPCSVHAEFMVGTLALGQACLRVLQYFAANNSTTTTSTHIFINHLSSQQLAASLTNNHKS